MLQLFHYTNYPKFYFRKVGSYILKNKLLPGGHCGRGSGPERAPGPPLRGGPAEIRPEVQRTEQLIVNLVIL